MTMPKIADHHLNRQACIYLRQSTPGQVRFNQESTERQYQLGTKASGLGWSPDRIRVLDRDLGQSGKEITNRDDFKTLVNDVAMGTVGAVSPSKCRAWRAPTSNGTGCSSCARSPKPSWSTRMASIVPGISTTPSSWA